MHLGKCSSARRQVQVGGFETEAQTSAALADAVAAHLQEVPPVGSLDTVAGFVRGRWTMAIRREVAESAWRNYRVVMHSYVLPRIGNLRLTRLTKSDIEEMYSDLLDTGRVTGGGLSPVTVVQIHRTLRRMLNDAVRWGLIRVNPAIGARLPKVNRRPIETWTLEETRTFLRSTAAHRLGPLWSVALAAGIHQKVVQERLGHTRVKMTLDVYSHVGQNLQDAAACELYRCMTAAVPNGDRIDPPIGESLEETPEALRAAARTLQRPVRRRHRATMSDRVFVDAINE